jgi:hypothetical protein
MTVQLIKGGAKNHSILVKGFVRSDFTSTEILDMSDAIKSSGLKGLRLDSAVWAIQEKMGLYLWWEKEHTEENLALVMESRNGMRFDEGLPSPRVDDGWKGKLYLSSFKHQTTGIGPAAFVLLLDFDKQ